MFQFDLSLLEPLVTGIQTVSVNFLFAYNPWECDCDNLFEMKVGARFPDLALLSFKRKKLQENASIFFPPTFQNFVLENRLLLRDADFLACGKDGVSFKIEIVP